MRRLCWVGAGVGRLIDASEVGGWRLLVVVAAGSGSGRQRLLGEVEEEEVVVVWRMWRVVGTGSSRKLRQ